ncbi:MAG: patatin-like phospholipase family protein [Desulfobacterales bacterium]|nr:patatin-like phospholipase family protein [Desulfobacterales bacterium]
MTMDPNQPNENEMSEATCPVYDYDYDDSKPMNIAIQGGGAHGAFAWGILDKILEDARIDIEGICATSAGSMNAVAMAYGRMQGGYEGARQLLDTFWKKISEVGAIFSPVKSAPWNTNGDSWNQDFNPGFALFETMTRLLSPYQFNPMNFNPLRNIVEEVIDFDVLRRCPRTKLYISTTKVRTGKVRVFQTSEISLDVVLASACLPYLFQAVEINGEYYWDGGYMGNPALFPLLYHTESRDVLIVHINPMIREELPTTSMDIMNRLNEITFNSSLLKEMREIALATKMFEEGWIKDEHKSEIKHMLLHSIRADEKLKELSVASKFNTDWKFLTHLKELGRKAAQEWLDTHFEKVGEESTIDLRGQFQDLGVDHVG